MPPTRSEATQVLVPLLGRLADLTLEERSALGALPSEVVSFRPGERITQAGEERSTCSLILEGFVSSSKVTAQGRRQITGFFIPGDLPDLLTLQLKVMDSDITALTPCRVAVVKHSDLLPLSRGYPSIAEALWTYTLVVSAIFHEWIVNVGARPALARIAHLLCQMMARLEAVGLAREGRCELPISQSVLAEATGLSRIHVNRSLQELRKQGLITLSFNALIIHDWKGLTRAGGFDGSYLRPLQPRWRTD